VKGRVLIADGDAERGRRIAAACTERGLVCRVTTHGAAALEVALGEVPDALVAQLSLPLIEGPKLAAILRANPRTQGIAVVFLGDRSDDAERHGVVGQVVPPPVEPAVVAGCVQTALGARGGRDSARHTADGGVEGQLAQLPLADLLQLFHVGRKTGRVEVTRGLGRSRRQVGRIHLRDGDVVAASVGSVEGEKALFRLLAWDRGSFVFKPEAPDVEATLRTPTRALLREGLRQIHEWERLAVDLPPLSATLTLRIPRSSLPNVIHPLTQEVLVVLDLYSRVQDVVDHCSYPDYQVLRTLHTLIQRGMLELHEEEAGPDLERETSLFSPARVARLREWLEVDRPGGAALRDAKLLVLSCDPAATRALARLLQRLPGAEMDRRSAENGSLGADDLVVLGRVAVDGEVGIELVHLPASPRFAPLWPVAGHGALATLFLLSGPVGEAREALGAAGRALAALPRSRAFHLLLLDKSERLDPDEVTRNLSLVDESSLFLLPLESPDKAAVLLREMFARVLP
jgi:CheY-like chemotaxis protein